MALVAFLRGVNVGGHRTLRPSVLAKQLARYDVVNVGAAGTFVIRRPVTKTRLRAELARRLPFDTHVMLCEGRELLALGDADSFRKAPKGPGVVRFVSVMGKRPREVPGTPLQLPREGAWQLKIFAVEGRFAFGVYRRHMKTIGYLGMLDKLLGVPVTTRNWNTITSVIKLLKNEM
ncbi:MAG TPA: DUF1697 domain-containing protein [Gammaproteobacteria bacterium]|nr:DUF1697 domain-containing protein [Gammaproteobacteria bacterium]